MGTNPLRQVKPCGGLAAAAPGRGPGGHAGVALRRQLRRGAGPRREANVNNLETLQMVNNYRNNDNMCDAKQA